MSDSLYPSKVSSGVQIPLPSTPEEVEETISSFFNALDDIFQEFEGKFYCKRDTFRVDILCIDINRRRNDCCGCPVWCGEAIGHG